mmetsp:Transcript_41667/g.134415  ORF Transcript_41667/g.134415 Transcript_41667/m.134415 type:complete len:274 (-) Transcript_41667:392-1213(-)
MLWQDGVHRVQAQHVHPRRRAAQVGAVRLLPRAARGRPVRAHAAPRVARGQERLARPLRAGGLLLPWARVACGRRHGRDARQRCARPRLRAGAVPLRDVLPERLLGRHSRTRRADRPCARGGPVHPRRRARPRPRGHEPAADAARRRPGQRGVGPGPGDGHAAPPRRGAPLDVRAPQARVHLPWPVAALGAGRREERQAGHLALPCDGRDADRVAAQLPGLQGEAARHALPLRLHVQARPGLREQLQPRVPRGRGGRARRGPRVARKGRRDRF